jgi:hypothetical protein
MYVQYGLLTLTLPLTDQCVYCADSDELLTTATRIPDHFASSAASHIA